MNEEERAAATEESPAKESGSNLSWQEIESRVQAAVAARYSVDGPGGALPSAWPVATYPNRVVIRSERDGKHWELPYKLEDGKVTLGEATEVVLAYQRVTEEYGCRFIEAVAGSEGREWDVILIQAGRSQNHRYYPADVLAAAAPLFEGVPAYADHASDELRRSGQSRSVRDKVGKFTNARFGQFKVNGQLVEGIQARFKVIAPWLRETLLEAVAAGEPDFLGFSIDARGRVTRKPHEGKVVTWVEAITHVDSVDVVSAPAAGGHLVRLVASNPMEDTMDREELERLIQEQVAAAVASALAAQSTPTAPAAQAAAETPAPELAAAQAAVQEARALREELRRERALLRLDAALGSASISDVGKQRLRADFTRLIEARDFTDEELAARITETREYEAAIAQQAIAPQSLTRQVSMGNVPHDRYYKAIQGMFAGEDVDGIPRFQSIKEAYCRWSGADPFEVSPFEIARAFSCRYDSAVDHKRLQESLTTSSWGEIYADNLYVMMIKSYSNAPYNEWRKIVSDIESVPDFQTRHWARVGGYSDLSTVAEQGTYPTLTSPTDEEVTYAIAKRGGLDDVTFEAIVNDRFGAIRRIPTAMGRAAARTLHKFVMNLITTDNPTMDYDSTALYHANHGNTGTTALSLSGLDITQQAMRDQTAYNESNEILGMRNKIKYLIVPNELEQRANRLVNPSDTYQIAVTGDTDTAIDPQAFKGKGIEVIVYDVLTDSNDWFAVADPREVPTVVMGFLNGRQEPELFVQDQPNVGSAFTADKVTYKIRHIFGGDVLEHRSFYRHVVS